MLGLRPRSPGASPAPWWAPQPAGPGPAKRPRLGEPAGPPNAALTSVVVLASGCALQLPLDDVDLVLEPAPASILQVSLPDHTLVLVGSADLGAGGQGDASSPDQLQLDALLGALGEDEDSGGGQQLGFPCASVPEIGRQEETYAEEDDPASPTPGMDPAAGLLPGIPEPGPLVPVPSPERSSPDPVPDQDFYLLEPFPNSPRQPQPSSPSSSPQAPQERSPSPLCKARRRLFQE